MSVPPHATLSPVQEAEQALQVAGVLTRMEQRFEAGDWARGARTTADGGNCLIGAIDEATRWTMAGTRARVTEELVARLPQPFRAIGTVRPRLGLALYNDSIGRRDGALALVRAARRDLGCLGGSAASKPRPVTRSDRTHARSTRRVFTAAG
jgi:hypothetical protein